MSLRWEEPVVAGQAPCPRSGHTLTAVGGKCFLFGGTGRVDGKAQAFNDLFELDASNSEQYKWRQIVCTPAPPARARHIAVALDERRLLVFGGVDRRTRFNDVWVFDSAADSGRGAWALVEPDGAAPSARAHATGTRVGEQVYVFGGYGGSGAVHNDLWVLRVGAAPPPSSSSSSSSSSSPSAAAALGLTFQWEELTAQLSGAGPSPRFDHSAFAFPSTPGSAAPDKLAIVGGRDLGAALSDGGLLDLPTLTWEPAPAPGCAAEACCAAIEAVPSVPHHQVFSFGGKRGALMHHDTASVLDCGSRVWAAPPLDPDSKRPAAREDTAWAYDARTSSLLMFGGWANRWLGDLLRLDASAIIGPPYACTGIVPEQGPVFGGTELTLTGLRFHPGKVQVRFTGARQGAAPPADAVVDAEYVSPTAVRCRAPNFEAHGPGTVGVRVSIDGEGWTVGKLAYAYHANTAARHCVAFGPGLAPAAGPAGARLPFMIAARDTLGERRGGGGDAFEVRLCSADDGAPVEGATATVDDLGTGLYSVAYSVPLPGSYQVHVLLAELGASAPVHIRGSPFTVAASDPWSHKRLSGGAAPARRKGASLVATAGGELLLYSGDAKAGGGAFMCSPIAAGSNEWAWSPVDAAAAAGGQAPPPRSGQAAAPFAAGLVIAGGVALSSGDSNNNSSGGGAELADAWALQRQPGGTGWQWSLLVASGSEAGSSGGGATAAAARSAPALAMLGPTSLLLFGGEVGGELVGDACLGDSSASASAHGSWQSLQLRGLVPTPRKGAAAAACASGRVAVFGGLALGADGVAAPASVTNELLLLDVAAGTADVTIVTPPPGAAWPPARAGASLAECGPGELLLCGGAGGDDKPFNDAWVLNVATLSWRCAYAGHPDQLGAPGALVAPLEGGHIAVLSSSPGSATFDRAATLNVLALAAAGSLTERMRAESAGALAALELEAERAAAGLEPASAPEALATNFDGLMRVMGALCAVKTRAAAIDLAVDGLREGARVLAAERAPGANKFERRLEELAARWEGIKKNAAAARVALEPIQTVQAEKIRADAAAFGARVDAARAALATRPYHSWSTGPPAAFAALDAAGSELAQLGRECDRFAELARLFDLADAVAPAAAALADARDDLAAMRDLWEAAQACDAQLAAWRAAPWASIKTDELEDGAKALLREVKALSKKARAAPAYQPLEACARNFLASVPLLADLRSPAMRPRHWDALIAATGAALDVGSPDLQLGQLLALELHRFEDEVAEVVDRAQKEEKMEAGLAKLEEAWGKAEFVFAPHKEGSDVKLVKMADEDFEMLEDHQVLVQGMAANRYAATFADRIAAWGRKLMAVGDVVQLLSEIQRTWAYLEALFVRSDEVRRELPDATQRFAGIDEATRGVLKEFQATRNCVACCARDGLLKFLETQQAALEVCEKALADFVESKRRAFPRFYFVSTADLLDMLSNGDAPRKVMPHMSKCFQAIDRLKLADGGGDGAADAAAQEGSGGGKAGAAAARPVGLGMVSCVGEEYVDFAKPLPLEGKVEAYMNDIVDAMRGALRSVLRASVAAYPGKPRDQWLFDWPSQVALVASQIFWCQEVEHAIADAAGDAGSGKAPNPHALRAYNEFQVAQLTRLIEVTRTALSRSDRQKVMNMVTIDAHARDVVASLADAGVARSDCFEWMSQLRSYWDAALGDCRIRICDASFPYGYEYLGNGPRLVVTPLTDRIYVTATQACWLCLGTAPAGPAGTGKTETTKDLSAQLGKSVYVFNCSPEMDYRTMGDIFKGLAASGSWGCFDEFNRLVPEVLSVCSVQYKCVTDAQRRKSLLPGRGLAYVDKAGVAHPAVPRWTFVAADGVEMPLEEGASAFITMNPGYIGRAELPESLKALFRPITVVAPDRQLIMENMLMAEGFVQAKVLARKFASLYYLLEDLLSPAKHYDWGLRAIKSVLVVAGSLLRAEPGQDEAQVLFRALRDFNVPKILAPDMVIFSGLLADLFPGVDPPRKRDAAFEDAIREAAREMKLAPDDDFVLRVVQLSELLAIRHCVFLMGPTGCGRTECYRVLARAIAKGTDDPVNDYLKATNRKKVVIRDIDPKAVTTQELYGFVNMATREWKDGLLSYYMRELAAVPDTSPKWILLDGDLDANWVESMNSVMDDSRLLTLPSNERIRLLPHMKMIFEIRDLKYATPATATRAGILYISEGRQWRAMAASWLERAVAEYAKRAKWKDPSVPAKWLGDLFDKYVPDALAEMRRDYSHVTPLGAMSLVTALVNALEGLLRPENLSNKAEQPLFEAYFVFAAIWAFGGALVEKDGIDYRKRFDKWVRANWTAVKLPGKGTVYDYYVNPKTGKFAPWAELVADAAPPVVAPSGGGGIGSVFVPTAETASLRFFLNIMVDLGRPIMFVGGAGVGKTQLVRGKLAELPDGLASAAVAFNYFTDVAAFQAVLEGPLEKRAGVNYGPTGGRRLVYFVDDLNTPRLDAYETAMPISLMRQHLAWGHWYDRTKLTQKVIHDTQYVAAMNPTAGSFVINPRLQRLFVTLAVAFPGSDALMRVFGALLGGHLSRFGADAQEAGTKILQAALALHERVAAAFRKTAVNFHYEFTVRHLAGVFQGLLMAGPDVATSPVKLARLWLHESERVYADRLVSPADLEAYGKAAVAVSKKYLPQLADADDFYRKKDPKPLIFCPFARGLGDRAYDEAPDLQHVHKVLGEALLEYNESNPVMDLVLFDDALRHVARIARAISAPGGHALLVGVGGSGKQSLARLAAFTCGYSVTTPAVCSGYGLSAFREDLARAARRAGTRGEGVVFLLTDGQIVDERMLVYVNDLLASGEAPDLFGPEERDEICNLVRGETKAAGLPDTPENCWATFVRRARANLHIVLTASPVGDAFRVRSQRFLATINATAIDWFQPWPEASLASVARRFLDGVELGDDAARAAVVDFMPASLAAVNRVSRAFLEAERRHNHTTPKTFLELVKLYRGILGRKRKATQDATDWLQGGLDKLHRTQAAVDVLIEDARRMAVEVERKVASANVFAERVADERAKVAAENAAAQVEADKCAAIAAEVSEKQAACEKDLAAAEPLVASAEAALDTLNKKDLGETKSLKKPPPGVDDITAVVIILLEGNPKDRSWAAATKLMNNVDKFMERLRGFKAVVDEGKVARKTVDAVRPYLELPHFTRDVIWSKSRAAAGLCDWAVNIVKYYDVVSEVEPKRQELAAANARLAEANAMLSDVRQKVAELDAKVRELEAAYAAAAEDKNAAVAESERCQRRLALANRLIAALASEGERWARTAESLRASGDALTGDMLLAAAFVSYAGPFTSRFRAGLVAEWHRFLADRKVPMTPGVKDPVALLVDDALVASWVRQGLPSDATSIGNGAILVNSDRWPLMVDPQLQGVLWVKEKEAKNGLKAVRMGGDGMMAAVERAMEGGTSILIEGVGEALDAALGPVIARTTFKKGRSLYVRLGDKDVEYRAGFRLFLHTKLSNPHYPPEVQAEVALINFAVTEQGLEDQLLALIVNRERPDLEETKTQLIIQSTEFTIRLKSLEDELLSKLSAAEGDLTEDVALIESLEESKRVATDIADRAAEARLTERAINESRDRYRPVAARGAMLFFLLDGLSRIHAFYRFSLGAFVAVFARGLDEAPGGRRKKAQPQEHAEGDEQQQQHNDDEAPPLSQPPPERQASAAEGGELGALRRRVTGEKKDFGEVMAMARRTNSQGLPDAAAAVPASASAAASAGAAAAAAGAPAAASDAPPPPAMTPEELTARLKALLDTCTYTVYRYTRRGLFDRDKLTVLALLAFSVGLRAGAVDPAEYVVLCRGARSAAPPPVTDELSRWVSEAQWAAIDGLANSGLPSFASLPKDLERASEEWSHWCAAPAPERLPMPGEWARAKDCQRLLVLRALRPDRVTSALQAYCERVMGPEYTRQEPFDVKALLRETTAASPIFFTLFPGYSPSKEVEAAAAAEPGGGVKLTTISMGQGQEAPAEAALARCVRDGGWVFLDNVHLMQAWIPRLERALEDAAERAHPNFRCFLSAEPIAGAPHAPVIPESILHGAAKVSNEPPADMASNMRRALAAFGADVEARLAGAPPGKVAALRSILFGLCFYHSLLLGRKKFGVGIGAGSGSGLGFCRNYSFNAGDLTTCGDVAANYLAAYDGAVPWADLRYMFGEVFYGGHITDAMDRRCCMAYLAMLMRPELLPGGDLGADPSTWTVPTLELAPGFRAPQRPTSMAALAAHIEAALPPESPVVYGMHPNAELSTLTLLGESLFRALAEGGAGDAAAAAAAAAANGGGGGGARSNGAGSGAASAAPAAAAAGAGAASPGGGGADAAVRAALKDYAERLPAPFDLADIDGRAKAKTPYVVAALQEAARMNALLAEMRRGMDELQLGLDGALNMSPAMEALAAAVAANAVPAAWMAAMSARVQEVLPLAAWYADVLKRHEQLSAWTAGAVVPPASVWLPGLFNPKAFLTAVMQTHARAAKLPLDEMRFITEVTAKTADQVTAPAPVGSYVHGLTLEGARWDRTEGRLADPIPGELRHAMPVMLVRPVTADEAAAAAAAGPIYECPVYVNMQRANVYSPCVATFTLRCAEEPRKWVLASAALLLQDELA